VSQPGNLLLVIGKAKGGVMLKSGHLHLEIANMIFSLSVLGREPVGSIGIDTVLLLHLLEFVQGFLGSLFTFTNLPLGSDTPGPFGSELILQVASSPASPMGLRERGGPSGDVSPPSACIPKLAEKGEEAEAATAATHEHQGC
jgi:hypothetical protein